MNIKDSVNSQMRINQDKILSYFNEITNNKDLFSYLSPPVLVDIRNGHFILLDLNSSMEFKIPLIMISILRNIRLDEFMNNVDIKSKYSYLITILYNISNNCFLNNTISRVNYWSNIGISLLKLIKDGDLSSKEFRDDIYNNLKIISGRIKYSDINDYEFY